MISVRKCVACGEMKKKEELFRVVKTDIGFDYDRTGKAQARGAYICRNSQCINIAKKKNSFAKSFHCGISSFEFLDTLSEALNDSF